MGKPIDKTAFCKLTEEVVKEQREAFVESVSKPKYMCKKCFRVSKRKQNLCKPEKLKEEKGR